MKKILLLSLALSTTLAYAAERPNLLFISVDDLNDFPAFMGVYPDAVTPQMDRLAERGTVFTGAHAQFPLCGPSRASVMTGMYPHNLGFTTHMSDAGVRERARELGTEVLHGYFAQAGYKTMAVGKIFHHHVPAGSVDASGDRGAFNEGTGRLSLHWNGQGTQTDWAMAPERDDQLPDHRAAAWAVDQIRSEHEQPFLLMVGFLRPHVPWYVPQKWFDLYDKDQLTLPAYRPDDLDDVPEIARSIALRPEMPRTEWALENDQWRNFLHAYLASVSFVDHQVGRVLEALENSPYADNTIVVLWSDHGYHLGEKNTFQKHTLWGRSSRVPLVFAGPGVPAGGRSDRVVGLIDLYPTLVELSGLPENPKNEGRSLVPLLHEPARAWPHPALTQYEADHFALQTDRYRYLRYGDGSEELYDHRKDIEEFDNLAGQSESEEVRREMARKLRALLEATATPTPAPSVVMSENFDQGEASPVARRLLFKPQITLAEGKGRDGSNAVRVAYVGFERGSERVVLHMPLGRSMDQATLAYDVMFDRDWQWVVTGKLHGLGPKEPITGGNERRPDGWSARVTFGKEGRVATYLYEQDPANKWGVGSRTEDPVFERGKWHRVVLQVSLNDVGQANGRARVFVDGEQVLETTNVEFRGSADPGTQIQQFLFSTFHGGNRPSNAPVDADGNFTTVHAYFDNFVVYEGVPPDVTGL